MQTVRATVAARNACSRESSVRARPTSTIVAASGIDEDVQRELGDVPPQVAQRVAHVVAPIADRRIGAEQILRCVSEDEPTHEDGDGEPADEPVQPAKSRDRRAQAARLEDREQERREQDGRSERDRLHPGRIRRAGEHEEEDHPERRGSFEHDDEHEHDEQEQRVEGVLRHDRSRVRERRDRDGEHRCEERQAVPRRHAARGRTPAPQRAT